MVTYKADEFDWAQVKSLGLHYRCGKMGDSQKNLTCGKILAHAREQVTQFREKIGIRVCCFKVGVTSNPLCRFASYVDKGYTHMWVIGVSRSVDLIHMLEAAIIGEFHKHVGCANAPGSGGEGHLNKVNPPAPPYYLYITGGRADQPRRVG